MTKWRLIAVFSTLALITIGASIWAFGPQDERSAPTAKTDRSERIRKSKTTPSPRSKGKESPKGDLRQPEVFSSNKDAPSNASQPTKRQDLREDESTGSAADRSSRRKSKKADKPSIPALTTISLRHNKRRLIKGTRDPRTLKNEQDSKKADPNYNPSSPFYDLVYDSRIAAGKRAERLKGWSDEHPIGYGRRVTILVSVEATLEVPETLPLFIEPTIGNETYEISMNRRKVNPPPNGEIKPGPDEKGDWNHLYLETQFVMPWTEEISDFYIYDDLNNPRLFALVSSKDSRLFLRLRDEKEVEKEGFRNVRVLFPDGLAAEDVAIVREKLVVAITDSFGEAQVPMGVVNGRAKEARHGEFTAHLPGYMPAPFTIHQEWPYSDDSQVDIRLPCAEVALKVKFDQANANLVLGSSYYTRRYLEDAKSADKPSWMPKAPMDGVLKGVSVLFFPESKEYQTPAVPVEPDGDSHIFSWISATTISSASIGLSMRMHSPEMKLLEARPFGSSVINALKASLDLGPDNQGYYRLRLPAMRGHYLLPFSVRSPSGKGGEQDRFFALRLSEEIVHAATKSWRSQRASFEGVDLRKDYQALIAPSIFSGQNWLRYYFGDDGAKAREPNIAQAPTPMYWPPE